MFLKELIKEGRITHYYLIQYRVITYSSSREESYRLSLEKVNLTADNCLRVSAQIEAGPFFTGWVTRAEMDDWQKREVESYRLFFGKNPEE